MLSLLADIHLWPITKSRSESISDSRLENLHADNAYAVHNNDLKNQLKLERSCKKLFEALHANKIVYRQWKSPNIIQFVLSNGLIIYFSFGPYEFNLQNIVYDKYLLGKLADEEIANVVVWKQHILITYHINQITLVTLQKYTPDKLEVKKINQMDPKIFHFLIGGPSDRKLERFISINKTGDVLAVWSKSSQNEIYPWYPLPHDQSNSNIHVHRVNNCKLESMFYCWTENNPLEIKFSDINPKLLHVIEQKISRKGEIKLEKCIYEMCKTRVKRTSLSSMNLNSPVSYCCSSPDNEKFSMSCTDGSLLMLDKRRGIVHQMKLNFIPNQIVWHCDSALILLITNSGQYQLLDSALATVNLESLRNESVINTFCGTAKYRIRNITFNPKFKISDVKSEYCNLDNIAIIEYEGGELGYLRLYGGNGLMNDYHYHGFQADILVEMYIRNMQYEKAANLMLTLNWDINGLQCLNCLQLINNSILKQRLMEDHERVMQRVFAGFYTPPKPILEETEIEYEEQVHDIVRKFCHHLIRYKSLENAFRLAGHMKDVDILYDIYHTARRMGNYAFAIQVQKQAIQLRDASSESAESESISDTNTSSSQDDIKESNPKIVTAKRIPKATQLETPSLVYYEQRETTNMFRQSILMKTECIESQRLLSHQNGVDCSEVRLHENIYLVDPPLPEIRNRVTTTLGVSTESGTSQMPSQKEGTKAEGKTQKSSEEGSVSDNSSTTRNNDIKVVHLGLV